MADAAIITVAGVSSRFNSGVNEEEKQLKAICYDKDKTVTLLSHLLKQCSYADYIVVVGGYKYDELKNYIQHELPKELVQKVSLIYNEHYLDLASGYSLYLGLKTIFDVQDVTEVLFVEGDLDIDDDSFNKVVNASKTVLTYNYEPVYASKSVVFYVDEWGKYKYLFNSLHGMIEIKGLFSSLFNSGQLWKFVDMNILRNAMEVFGQGSKTGTNLEIIQTYIDLTSSEAIDIIGLEKWTNCNTKEDFSKILARWEREG